MHYWIIPKNCGGDLGSHMYGCKFLLPTTYYNLQYTIVLLCSGPHWSLEGSCSQCSSSYQLGRTNEGEAVWGNCWQGQLWSRGPFGHLWGAPSCIGMLYYRWQSELYCTVIEIKCSFCKWYVPPAPIKSLKHYVPLTFDQDIFVYVAANVQYMIAMYICTAMVEYM